MKAALFYHGNEEYPTQSLLLKLLLEDDEIQACFQNARTERLNPTRRRGRASLAVREVYRKNFGQLLGDSWQLRGRVYELLNSVESFYKALLRISQPEGELLIFFNFELSLQEERVYKFSGFSGPDLIWLKLSLRTAIDELLAETGRFDLMLYVCVGTGEIRRLINDSICDNHSRGIPWPWADKVITVFENDIVIAARGAATEILVASSALGSNELSRV